MTRINAEDVEKIESAGDGFWFVKFVDDVRKEKRTERLTKSEVRYLFEAGCVDV